MSGKLGQHPAFPRPVSEISTAYSPAYDAQAGMTYRQWMAGQVASNLSIHFEPLPEVMPTLQDIDRAARVVWMVADAILAHEDDK